jgi:hypothetical protein
MPERGIVIGASAGGIEALKEVVSQLPASLPAPVFGSCPHTALLWTQFACKKCRASSPGAAIQRAAVAVSKENDRAQRMEI